MDLRKLASATDVVEGDLEVAFREPHNPTHATPARTVHDEDPFTFLEATHAGVMRSLLSKNNRRPWRERLVAAEEPG
jgi:hypothetical protein